MMWGWAASRPRHCLKIGPRGVSWAQMRRDWKGRPHVRSSALSLPPGLVRPSPVESNLTDPTALQKRLESLVGRTPDLKMGGHLIARNIPRPITLLLPDLSVRTALLHLDQLPRRREEREALIRWKLGQEQLFPLTGMKVVSSLLPSGTLENTGSFSVLAVAVQETILAQYESLCDDLHLVALEIDTVSSRLFNLWLRTTKYARLPTDDFAWVHLADGGLTMLIFQAGSLVFLRTKLQAVTNAIDMQKTVAECVASIQACRQRHPTLAVTRLLLVTEDSSPGLRDMMQEQAGVAVEEWDWNHGAAARWARRFGSPHRTTLQAVAGLV